MTNLEEFLIDRSKIPHEELGELNCYLSSDKSLKPKPLLIYLDGSGAYPLFVETEQGFSSSIAFDYQNLRKSQLKCNHQFFEQIFAQGKFKDAIPHMDEALENAVAWLGKINSSV